MASSFTQEELEKFAIAMTVFQEERDDSQLIEIFKIWDRDGNGSVDKEELKAVMSSLSQQEVSDETVNEMLAEADVNSDGKIDYEEFVKIMKDKRDS